MAKSTVTCHTPDCGNENVAIELTVTYLDEDTGQERTVGQVNCGVCGQLITDIDPALDQVIP